MVILGSGALGYTTSAVVSLFKPIWGTEVDKPMRGMWVDVCATICYGDTDARMWVGGGRPIYIKSSTECKMFSSGGLKPGLNLPEGARYLKQVKTIVEMGAVISCVEGGSLLFIKAQAGRAAYHYQAPAQS